jgi:hypothetical protein
MKLTLLFLLLASVSVQGQLPPDTAIKSTGKMVKDTTNPSFTFTAGPTYMGFNEGQTSVSMNLKDSTFRVSGKDSLAAIKMMWIRIHENSKMYEKQILWLHRHIDKQEKLIKELMQYAKDRDKIDQELRENLKKVMSKKQ